MRPSGASTRSALATVIAASAAPYGFTISIWGTGAVLLSCQGVPTLADVFGFMAGALGAFCVLAFSVRAGGDVAADTAADRVLAGTLHWIATGSAIGAAALLARLGGWTAWPVSSFAATSVYLVGASMQLAALRSRRLRRPATDEP